MHRAPNLSLSWYLVQISEHLTHKEFMLIQALIHKFRHYTYPTISSLIRMRNNNPGFLSSRGDNFLFKNIKISKIHKKFKKLGRFEILILKNFENFRKFSKFFEHFQNVQNFGKYIISRISKISKISKIPKIFKNFQNQNFKST